MDLDIQLPSLDPYRFFFALHLLADAGSQGLGLALDTQDVADDRRRTNLLRGSMMVQQATSESEGDQCGSAVADAVQVVRKRCSGEAVPEQRPFVDCLAEVEARSRAGKAGRESPRTNP
jgi:hypothetical protein